MSLSYLADRGAATIFMLAAAVLLALPKPGPRARVAWLCLIVLGVGYGLALNLQPANFPASNFVHYYLGAKYPAPYLDTYRLIRAGQGLPQIEMRDLAHPERVVGETDEERRLYYIDLLRAARAPFDPLAPLDSLAARARDSGAVEAEARQILASHLPEGRIADYRRDVRTAASMGQAERLTLDVGYNGSPFYGLFRQLDPTLHLPLDRRSAIAGLAWQLLGVALIAWLAGLALGLSTTERLAVAALILVSSDFATFAMTGLIITELWVPILVAAWALRSGRYALAGAAIAIAGLVKLFPFLLTLVAVVPLVRSYSTGSKESDSAVVRRRAFALLATCGTVALAMGLLSLTTGRTWADFFHKIAVEFESHVNIANSVSMAAVCRILGVRADSPLPRLISLAALIPLAALFWTVGGARNALPRRALVLIGATGWLVESWLNYYAVAPFVLLPLVARRHRTGAAAIAIGMAASYLTPGFYDSTLIQEPGVRLLKLAPYLAAPAWLVWLELRDMRFPVRYVRVVVVVAVLLILALGEEIWRGQETKRLADSGEAAFARSDVQGALQSYERVLRLAPGDGTATHRRAIALATLGRMGEALPQFARAAELSPRDISARDDYGRELLMSGRVGEAANELESARRLAPSDVQVLFALSSARLAQGRRDDAAALLERARELAPMDPRLRQALDQIAPSAGSSAPR
jgi:Flp pilus assembly protein TadD